jgi:subtilisin-like proprotein convertase family protein
LDQSAVPTVTLQVRLPDGRELGQVCVDASPEDGQWACAWEAPVTQDGAVFQIRARGTDILRQAGAWTRWLSFTQDLTPPALTLGTATQRALADGVIGPDETVFVGDLSDNRLVGGVEMCDVSSGITVCHPHPVPFVADAGTIPQTMFIYDDVPAMPLPLGASQTCEQGRQLVRTFVVSESFDVAGIQVGLNIGHPYRADVSAWLVAPSGATVKLLQGGAQASNYDLLLSDSAALAAAQDRGDHVTAPPLYNQARRPYELLDLLNGEAARGEWRLILCDAYPETDDGLYLRSRLILTADTLPQDSQGTWRYALAGVSASDNITRALAFHGRDSVGNRTTLNLTFRVDTVAPVVTVTRAASTAVLGVAATVLEGEVRDGDQVGQVLVQVQTPAGGSYSDHASLPEEGSWLYTLDPRHSGTYTLRVRATDRVGNSRTVGPFQIVVRAEYHTYLPLISKR